MSSEHYPQRKSPRLQGYNYTESGAYFVTICTHKKVHWFGSITDGMMLLHPMGQIATDCWVAIPNHFVGIELDVAVVMPNHIHGIIVLPGSNLALGTVIGSYKSAVTRTIRSKCRKPPDTLWQERYYDYIIRNEQALEQIRDYILYNPARWQKDPMR